MSERTHLVENIHNINDLTFENIALDVFNFQYRHNPLYRQYCQLLMVHPSSVRQITDIPFLPISFFKSHRIKTGEWQPQCQFESSGTTSDQTSIHLVRDADLYKRIAINGFKTFYSEITDYCILALLPSYLERSHSSLIYMVKEFMEESGHPRNGFFLDDIRTLVNVLKDNQQDSVKTILFGVTFALLDLAEQFPFPFKDLIIMETGGMKGRRKEITRQEVHAQLMEAFGVPSVHSEYGMTELLSQAYSQGEGIFSPSPTMRIFMRDPSDPLNLLVPGKTGCLNIVDLGNLDSCSFIATDDLGKNLKNGDFIVSGRLDQSDIRGCNLLVT